MNRKPIKYSPQEYHARMKRRAKRRQRYLIRLTTISILSLLCIFAVIFLIYKIISGGSQAVLPDNALDSYQPDEILSPNAPSDADTFYLNKGAVPITIPATTEEPPVISWVEPDLYINSTNAILMNLENGSIVFDKESETIMYPASMTKILTAVVVLEQISDLNEKVLLNEAIFQPIYDANAVTAGFIPGESVRVIDLLYGLMLPSGAECAVGLAEYIAGSESAFVDLMNDKAYELGMNSSNFTNTIGLHDANHYSTALDIAVLLKYALNNETFYKIFTSKRYSTPPTNQHVDGITYYSTLFSRIDTPDFDDGSILGGKTGFTGEAGQCLASVAVKDDSKYILVTSGAPGDNQTQKLHIDDAFTVYAAITK